MMCNCSSLSWSVTHYLCWLKDSAVHLKARQQHELCHRWTRIKTLTANWIYLGSLTVASVIWQSGIWASRSTDTVFPRASAHTPRDASLSCVSLHSSDGAGRQCSCVSGLSRCVCVSSSSYHYGSGRQSNDRWPNRHQTWFINTLMRTRETEDFISVTVASPSDLTHISSTIYACFLLCKNNVPPQYFWLVLQVLI